jgi:hypothetical protein
MSIVIWFSRTSEKSWLLMKFLNICSVPQNDLSGNEQMTADDTLIGFGCGFTPLLAAEMTPYAASNEAAANRQMTK